MQKLAARGAAERAILAQMHSFTCAPGIASSAARCPTCDCAAPMERHYNTILSAKKVSSGPCITAPGDLVDDFHHIEGLDLLL
jgi:hypothetical protein